MRIQNKKYDALDEKFIAPADFDLRRRVTTFLSSQHRPGLRGVKVEAHNGTVKLEGRVATFYEKQLSSQLAKRVAGVVRLIDRVAVNEVRLSPGQATKSHTFLISASRAYLRDSA